MKSKSKIIEVCFILVWLIIITLPILSLIICSFKNSSEFYTTMPYELPINPTLENYITVLQDKKLYISFLNTSILIIFSIIVSTFLSSMVAFVLERFNFKYKKMLITIFLVISFFPMAIMQVSVFKMMTITHLYNKFLGLALLYSVGDIVIIYLFRDNIRKLSTTIDASARLYGATYPQIYWRLILPNLKSTIMIVAIFKVINVYNDFYFQSLYLISKKTISTFLYQYTSPYEMLWPQISASIIVIVVGAIGLISVIYKIYLNSKGENNDLFGTVR